MKTFELPPLSFPTDALEPQLSRETLELHHGKHHAGYVKVLNELVRGTRFTDHSLSEIIRISAPGPLHNNAAQHFNHSFYWNCLRPAGGATPTGILAETIRLGFGSFDTFARRFTTIAAGQFGSGWAWLMRNPDGSLSVEASTNAETPAGAGRTPLLTCDVWEHAYYVDYRNDRGKYLDAFWSLVNWDFVAANLAATDRGTTSKSEAAIDQTLADSFPASDPPSF
jgi:superoxide dismutase, Fe-Mn family